MTHTLQGYPPRLLAVSEKCPQAMLQREYWSIKDFVLVKEVGSGAASTVYYGICRKSTMPVAIKMYLKAKLSRLNRKQVEREVTIHSSLNHPHIIDLYAAFEDDDRIYLVQEYAAGGDLFDDVKRRGGRMPEGEVVQQVLYPYLCALYYLHSRGVIHRDIKPENTVFTKDRVLKVTDFGLAINAGLERPVTRLGTLDYMAPEVLRCPDKHNPEDNKERVDLEYDASVDAWAMGVLAFELIVGRPPFGMSCREDTMRAITAASPSIPDWMSPAAADFIRSALQRTPSRRPAIGQLLQHSWIVHHIRPTIELRSATPRTTSGEVYASTAGAGPSRFVPQASPAGSSVSSTTSHLFYLHANGTASAMRNSSAVAAAGALPASQQAANAFINHRLQHLYAPTTNSASASEAGNGAIGAVNSAAPANAASGSGEMLTSAAEAFGSIHAHLRPAKRQVQRCQSAYLETGALGAMALQLQAAHKPNDNSYWVTDGDGFSHDPLGALAAAAISAVSAGSLGPGLSSPGTAPTQQQQYRAQVMAQQQQLQQAAAAYQQQQQSEAVAAMHCQLQAAMAAMQGGDAARACLVSATGESDSGPLGGDLTVPFTAADYYKMHLEDLRNMWEGGSGRPGRPTSGRAVSRSFTSRGVGSRSGGSTSGGGAPAPSSGGAPTVRAGSPSTRSLLRNSSLTGGAVKRRTPDTSDWETPPVPAGLPAHLQLGVPGSPLSRAPDSLLLSAAAATSGCPTPSYMVPNPVSPRGAGPTHPLSMSTGGTAGGGPATPTASLAAQLGGTSFTSGSSRPSRLSKAIKRTDSMDPCADTQSAGAGGGNSDGSGSIGGAPSPLARCSGASGALVAFDQLTLASGAANMLPLHAHSNSADMDDACSAGNGTMPASMLLSYGGQQNPPSESSGYSNSSALPAGMHLRGAVNLCANSSSGQQQQVALAMLLQQQQAQAAAVAAAQQAAAVQQAQVQQLQMQQQVQVHQLQMQQQAQVQQLQMQQQAFQTQQGTLLTLRSHPISSPLVTPWATPLNSPAARGLRATQSPPSSNFNALLELMEAEGILTMNGQPQQQQPMDVGSSMADGSRMQPMDVDAASVSGSNAATPGGGSGIGSQDDRWAAAWAVASASNPSMTPVRSSGGAPHMLLSQQQLSRTSSFTPAPSPLAPSPLGRDQPHQQARAAAMQQHLRSRSLNRHQLEQLQLAAAAASNGMSNGGSAPAQGGGSYSCSGAVSLCASGATTTSASNNTGRPSSSLLHSDQPEPPAGGHSRTMLSAGMLSQLGQVQVAGSGSVGPSPLGLRCSRGSSDASNSTTLGVGVPASVPPLHLVQQ